VKRAINIGFLTSDLAYGGAARSLLYLLKSINHFEVRSYVYARGIRGKKIVNDIKRISNSLTVVNVGQISSNRAYRVSDKVFVSEKVKNYQWFIELLKKDKIEILHINTTAFPHILQLVKRLSDIKIVTHIREVVDTDYNSIGTYIVENILKYSDALITISDNEIQPFSKHPFKFIIPNPIDLEEIRNVKSSFRQQYHIKKNTVLVGMLGNFTKMKGQLEFVKILKLLNNVNITNADFYFAMVGMPTGKDKVKLILKRLLRKYDYRNVVLSFIRNNKLRPKILLINTTYAVYDIIAALDIVVRPAISQDPWGRDIIEAMAFSKPVVAFGKSEYYIKNNISGYLVHDLDLEEFSNRVMYLISNKDVRMKLGNNGFNIIKAECDLDNYGVKVYNIYMNLLL